jgi:hypothetical protein
MQKVTDVLVIPAKDQIRVFVNDCGSITIESISHMGESSVVMIDPYDVTSICRALKIAAKECRQ